MNKSAMVFIVLVLGLLVVFIYVNTVHLEQQNVKLEKLGEFVTAATNTPAVAPAMMPEPPVKITWERTIPTNTPIMIERGFGDDGLIHYQIWKMTKKDQKVTAPKKRWWKR